MGESIEHQTYVRNILGFIERFIDNENYSMIRVDLPEYDKPSLVYSDFIPDVYYSYDKLLIIGEAKTYDDFKTEHSKSQYRAYFEECKKYPFRSIITIAVPWQLFVTAKNHFRRCNRLYGGINTEIYVISENGVFEKI